MVYGSLTFIKTRLSPVSADLNASPTSAEEDTSMTITPTVELSREADLLSDKYRRRIAEISEQYRLGDVELLARQRRQLTAQLTSYPAPNAVATSGQATNLLTTQLNSCTATSIAANTGQLTSLLTTQLNGHPAATVSTAAGQLTGLSAAPPYVAYLSSSTDVGYPVHVESPTPPHYTTLVTPDLSAAPPRDLDVEESSACDGPGAIYDYMATARRRYAEKTRNVATAVATAVATVAIPTPAASSPRYPRSDSTTYMEPMAVTPRRRDLVEFAGNRNTNATLPISTSDSNPLDELIASVVHRHHDEIDRNTDFRR